MHPCQEEAVLGQLVDIDRHLGLPRKELLRIAARTFCREIAGHRRTETLLKRFTLYRLRVAAQNAVCGVRHDIRQRARRWLLATADRAGSNEIPLPQSLLAEMLGVRRQSVGLVAVELQRQGIISTRRARVRILDRRSPARARLRVLRRVECALREDRRPGAAAIQRSGCSEPSVRLVPIRSGADIDPQRDAELRGRGHSFPDGSRD